MNITHDLVVNRSLRYNVYLIERKLFDAQAIGEGYHHDFTHQFEVTWKTDGPTPIEIHQIITIEGYATCNCSLGFNTYINNITAKEAQ